MSCQSVCDYDQDTIEFLDLSTIKHARKPHKCCECKSTIHPGNSYERATGVWCGEFSTFATCATCASIRETLVPCGAFGRLRMEIWECLGLDYITGKLADWEQ